VTTEKSEFVFPTGISPLTVVLGDLVVLRDQLQGVEDKLDVLAQSIVARGQQQPLPFAQDDNQFPPGLPDQLHVLFQQNSRILELLEGGETPVQVPIQDAVPLIANANVVLAPPMPDPPLVPVPPLLVNTYIPKAVGGGLLLYLVGSQAEGTSCLPLMNLPDAEFKGNKEAMRVYQGYRAAMARYCKKAFEMDLLPKDLSGIDISLAEVNQIVNQVLPALGVAARTETGRVRTLPLMGWSSAENERIKSSRVTQ
jgi:hypothetical protein